MKILKRIDRDLTAIILFALFIITLLQIILRSLFDIPLIGVEELLRYLFISFIFLGLPYYFRIGGHIRLEGLQKLLPQKIAHSIEIVIKVSSILVFGSIFFSAVYTTLTNYNSTTPTLSLPFWLFFLPAIIGFGILTIEHTRDLYLTIKKKK